MSSYADREKSLSKVFNLCCVGATAALVVAVAGAFNFLTDGNATGIIDNGINLIPVVLGGGLSFGCAKLANEANEGRKDAKYHKDYHDSVAGRPNSSPR